MQVFFSDPDMDKHPNKIEIDKMIEKFKLYNHPIRTTDGSIKIHTVENPYPPFS